MITFSYTHPDKLVIIAYHSRLYHWINHIKSWIIVIKSGFHVIIGCDLPVLSDISRRSEALIPKTTDQTFVSKVIKSHGNHARPFFGGHVGFVDLKVPEKKMEN